jgi:hypothetical protein
MKVAGQKPEPKLAMNHWFLIDLQPNTCCRTLARVLSTSRIVLIGGIRFGSISTFLISILRQGRILAGLKDKV